MFHLPNIFYTITNLIDNASEYLAFRVQHFFHFFFTDDGVFQASNTWARDIFIATSVVLVIVMLLARPRNLLDVTLTLREIFLSSILISSIIASREHERLPQWYVLFHFYIISVVGVLLIWAILREYIVSYWSRNSWREDEDTLTHIDKGKARRRRWLRKDI